VPEDLSESIMQRMHDKTGLYTKRSVGGSLNDISQTKNKGRTTPVSQKNSSSITSKASSKINLSNTSRQINIGQEHSNLSLYEIANEAAAKTPLSRRFDENKTPVNNNLNDALAQKLKIALQGLQGDLQNAKHRRGLSSGHNPIFIDQNVLREKVQQEREKLKPVVENIPPPDPQQTHHYNKKQMHNFVYESDEYAYT